ncbi:MAG: Abi family protein [Bacteroidales bacterium]|nr:Abi family protein [Bacteroidales bacterium]
MAKTLYNDSPLTTGGIIQLLKSRGLAFKDETKASHLLDHISFFRFKSYLQPLIQNKQTGTFKIGFAFEDAYTLYKFDSALRKLICAEMEKIEISLRTIISQELSHTYSPYWFTDKTLFSNQTKYSGILSGIEAELKRSDDDQILGFKKTYSNQFPPSWMTMEVSSFGTLSLLFKYLNGGRTKRNIANHFGVADTVLESWIHSFVYVRNICAHHSRLWNKTLRVTGGFPKRTSHGFINTRVQNDRVYYILCIIRYMLLTINPNSSFTARLKQLLQDYPSVDIKAMGFSANWESEPLWNTK